MSAKKKYNPHWDSLLTQEEKDFINTPDFFCCSDLTTFQAESVQQTIKILMQIRVNDKISVYDRKKPHKKRG